MAVPSKNKAGVWGVITGFLEPDPEKVSPFKLMAPLPVARSPEWVSRIRVISFFVPLLDLVLLVVAFFDSSLLICHFSPFTQIVRKSRREVTREVRFAGSDNR